ncbi:hypothetical protein T439DRAFT_325466 [Meredithblackwellia eburnea MCA 4105]
MSQLGIPTPSTPPTLTTQPQPQEAHLATRIEPTNSVEMVTEEPVTIDNEQLFANNSNLLVNSLDKTEILVQSLSKFNQDKWTIRYPHQLGLTPPPPSNTPTSATAPQSLPTTPIRSALRRSHTALASGADEQSPRPIPSRAYSTLETPAKKHSHSTNTASSSDNKQDNHPLSILTLDLKLDVPSNVPLPSLLPTLSLSTLSTLLGRRLQTSINHLDSLRTRVKDSKSRILVTGDLNAGKSTLVNALLRRKDPVMLVDQQPCTTSFCEVLDASENDGVQEVHAIPLGKEAAYNPKQEGTFVRFGLEDVGTLQCEEEEEDEVQDQEEGEQERKERKWELLKVYLKKEQEGDSFIQNGLVSLSLIDAPGLNRNTLSTTSLFTTQQEIDVILFVISAENHFTLSSKEFLWNASREKAYVFVVVNKWKAIKDKKRCERLVGEQIRQLSPRTWEEREELVHFVDADDVLSSHSAGEEVPQEEEDAAFAHLEKSLRSFVLLKRSLSKLQPAKHFLNNLLSDLLVISSANELVAQKEVEEALAGLEKVRPVHERLVRDREKLEGECDRVEETFVDSVKKGVEGRLDSAINSVRSGALPTSSFTRNSSTPIGLAVPSTLPTYPGLSSILAWATEIKQTFVKSLECEIRLAEEFARGETVKGVDEVMRDLAARFLPSKEAGDDVEGSKSEEGSKREFQPHVMFAKRRRGLGALAARGGMAGLGLGLAAGGSYVVTSSALPGGALQVQEIDISFLDFINLDRFIPSRSSSSKSSVDDDDSTLEAGALVSLGLGGMGMIGSRLVGVKGTLETVGRIMDVLGSKQAREWAGPVIGVLTIGLTAYLLYDLPHALPHNVGRKLHSSLPQFSTSHADRISRETRKVLRLASWDLSERFRVKLEEVGNERKRGEERLRVGQEAGVWLNKFEKEVREERAKVGEVDV